ncbi:unnamed protein product [Anisakis simplex]|uniref:Uncharacterized protein n=1 Tax=Anisakis simplex TaxID=6269 RepID=A0A3P6PPJ5_ANISI|nr:unnamed protein product [Anisakis simplex]
MDDLAPKPSTLGGARLDYTHQYNPPAQQRYSVFKFSYAIFVCNLL